MSFVVVLLARTVLGSPRAAELESCWRRDQDSAPSLALHQRAGRLRSVFLGPGLDVLSLEALITDMYY